MPEEKTIGEMLKEEGLIKEEKVEEEKPETEEVDIRKVLVEVEKLKAVVDTLKAVKFEADERIKELAEAIGEIRSLFFQRDASIREMEAKLGKIGEIVEEIKPDKIRKLIRARDKEVDEISARLEKAEEILKDLSQRTIKTEKILGGIRSIENLENIDKDIGEKLSKIEELKSSVERDAAKSERFYLEGEKRLKELRDMKVRLDKVDGLTKELVRSLDDVKIKLDARITKEDFTKALEEELNLGAKKEEKRAEKEEKKKEIVSLLKNVEEQYKKRMISESAYKEIREKNEAMLENIEKEIKRIKTEEEPKNLGDWLDSFERKIEDVRIGVNSNEKKIRALEAEVKKLVERGLKEVKPEIKVSPEALSLNKEIEEIKDLLANLEDQYRQGIISEKTYREVREKNLEKIEKVKEKMMEGGRRVTDERIEKLMERLNELEGMVKQKKTEETEPEDIDERLEMLKKKMDEMKRSLPLVVE